MSFGATAFGHWHWDVNDMPLLGWVEAGGLSQGRPSFPNLHLKIIELWRNAGTIYCRDAICKELAYSISTCNHSKLNWNWCWTFESSTASWNASCWMAYARLLQNQGLTHERPDGFIYASHYWKKKGRTKFKSNKGNQISLSLSCSQLGVDYWKQWQVDVPLTHMFH
jgi:hypothetical protein